LQAEKGDRLLELRLHEIGLPSVALSQPYKRPPSPRLWKGIFRSEPNQDRLRAKDGARGRICTDTGDALDVVPLLIGLHERDDLTGANGDGPPLLKEFRAAYASVLSVVSCSVMVGVPGNAPGLGTDLVRFRL